MNLTGEINVNIHKLFPSRWLTAADLDSRDWKMTVIGLKIENIGQPPKNEDKPILYFKGTEKAMVLNKTNGMLISSQHGPETDNWMGKVITLYPTRVKAFGGLHDCIRVRDGNYISSAPDPVVEADDDMPPDEDSDPIAEPPTNGHGTATVTDKGRDMPDVQWLQNDAGAQAEASDTDNPFDDTWNAEWVATKHYPYASDWGRNSGKFNAPKHFEQAWAEYFTECKANVPENAAHFLEIWHEYVNHHVEKDTKAEAA